MEQSRRSSRSPRWRARRRQRRRSCRSATGSRTAARSRPARGRRCSGSRTAASTPTAGTSPARWAASSAPPLKLLDSLYFGVEGQWVGPATRFTSGWGYTRYDLPPVDGIRLRRTDFAPDGRRGALLGLTLRTLAAAATVDVMVDAHSELMTQYPWGFDGT